MTDQVIVYCDESGNSGANYLDSAQPFYVLAGWVLPVEEIVEVSVLLEKLRSDYCPQRRELKSSAMLASESRRAGIADVFESMGQMGCCPVYLYAEKRYCVAGKIVETFLDPYFNPNLRTGFTSDVVSKQEIANLLYANLPYEVLARFAAAYRNPTQKGFLKALSDILDAVRTRIGAELARALEGSQDRLREIADTEYRAGSHGRAYKAFNLPALISFLMMIEHLARQDCFEVTKVVHDEQHTYQDDFLDVFRMHQTETEGCFVYPNGATNYASLKRIPTLEMAPSHTVIPIQASDLLAGVVNHLCTKALRGEDYSPNEMRLGDLTFPAMFAGPLKVAWAIGSNEFYCRLGQVYFSRIQASAVVDDGGGLPQVPSPPVCDLPVVPPTGGKADLPETNERRLQVDVPLYGLVGKVSGGLMVVGLGSEASEHMGFSAAALLFSNHDAAARFLDRFADGELTEEQEIRSFGPAAHELFELAGKLYSCLQMTPALLYDGNIVAGPYVNLKDFTDGLMRSTERVVRVFRSGFDKVLVERHRIGETEVTSMLTSSGQYGALISPNGKVYFGKTREAAVEGLRKSEGI